jgi:hypothetical protein
VAEALAAFDALGERWGQTKGDLDDARGAIKEAEAEDIKAGADVYAAGKTPRDLSKREDAARAKVETLESQLAALSVAVDQAGDALAQAIAEHRDEWAETQAEVEEEAAFSFARKMEEAQAALSELRAARGGIEYLRNFDVKEAIVGRQPQFSGGKIIVEAEGFGPLRGEHRPEDLLTLAAKAAEPVAEPEPRPLASTVRRPGLAPTT